jgi:GMP synthase-like glutamine amidotransferase
VPTAVVLSHDWVAHELGHLEPVLASRDIAITRIYREDPRPLPPADLLIGMGSPWSVATGHATPSSAAEIDLVRHWVWSGRPYLGLCYGAQVLACASGGEVDRLPTPFHGYLPIDTRSPSLPGLAGPWTVWHNDGIRAAPSASTVASLDHADLVFHTGRAWGIQPHVEVDADSLLRMAQSLGSAPEEYGPIVEALRVDSAANAERAGQLLDGVLTDLLTA